MVQRIECIPVDTERGMQVKRSAAHLAFQEMLQFDTVNLCGLITVIEEHTRSVTICNPYFIQ